MLPVATPTLRRETAGLVRLAERDLAALWQLVAEGVDARAALNDLLPAIVAHYGEAGAAMAADWYDDLREQTEVRGRFSATPVESSDRGARALVAWALVTATTDASLRSLVLGGVQRRIADHVRLTIAESAVADPGARGWQRVGDGSACDYCAKRITSTVYAREIDFSSHDNCGCSAAPAWR